MKYERLTDKKGLKTIRNEGNEDNLYYLRLQSLEDKIENGTLIEVDNKVYSPIEGVWSDCCSNCGQAVGNNGYIENYCSHCGVKLKEKGEV